jgi:hypothetical protein
VSHYVCKGEDGRYSVTVNSDRKIVKMQEHKPTAKLTTFQMLKTNTDDCGRGGWTLTDNSTFCYYTQGYASLTWHGKDFECEQADTN